MIGREAYKNPWIFSSDIKKSDLDKKKSIVLKYLTFLKLNFSKDPFNKNALFLVPLISLFGSVILSFHAYFLIFSRNYTEFIEQKINKAYLKIHP